MSFPNLSALAVRERGLTLFFLLLSVFGGVWAFVSLGRAEDPAFTVRVMVVSAVWPGATTEQMQRQVVDRLEKRIQEVEYLYKVETTIRPGRADLQVEFHDFTPQQKIPELQYQVRKRMQDEAARLPQGVIGPLVNDDFADVYFTVLALTALGQQVGVLVITLCGEPDMSRAAYRRFERTHRTLTERLHLSPATLTISGTRWGRPPSEARKASSPGFRKPLQLTSPGPAAVRTRTSLGSGCPGRAASVMDFAVTAPKPRPIARRRMRGS